MYRLVKPFFCSLLLILTTGFVPALQAVSIAQTDSVIWNEPINLSHSGSSSNPWILVDSNDVFHVIWEDEFAGYVYTRSTDGTNWSTPVPVAFPFTSDDTLFKLVTSNDDTIHAIWMHSDGELLYSHVAISGFGNPAAWDAGQVLAKSVLDADITIDTQNDLHVAYVRPLETSDAPAGIYYKRSLDSGFNWSAAKLLYQSLYFRGLDEDQANVDIDVGGAGSSNLLYIAWDNFPRKQVFLSSSKDNGISWGEPLEVSGPEESSGFANSFNISITVVGDRALMIWQVGDPGGNCIQYYQWSMDGGATWVESQRMLKDFSGCPQENWLFVRDDGLILLMTTIQQQVYLLAWDGKQWSDPQTQLPLNSYVDPESFDTVVFGCRQSAYLIDQDRLVVVSCDTNRDGDIWSMSRVVGDVSVWFPPPPIWEPPVEITNSETEIKSPVLIADSNGWLHALWNQSGIASEGVASSDASAESTIYYARWDGETWKEPIAVITIQGGKVNQLSAAIDKNGRLLLVYSGGQSGEIYFSWANASRATNISEWAVPVLLPSTWINGSSPEIQIDTKGVIYVVYAVPLNEGRGIYLTKSENGGNTWTNPVQVFNGISENWEMVDSPHLAITADGRLHLLWSRYTIPSGTGSLGLFYSSSEDGGSNWSKASEVVDKPVIWSDIVGTKEHEVHRVWQENNAGRIFIYHQYSQDGGLSWGRPAPISGSYTGLGPVSLSFDSTGRPHFLQVSIPAIGKFTLQYLFWNGEGWSASEGFELKNDLFLDIKTLSSAISLAGRLSVIYSGSMFNRDKNQFQDTLNFANRSLDLPAISIVPVQTSTITPTSIPLVTGTPIETLIPSLTASPEILVAEQQTPQSNALSLNSIWGGLIIGGALVVILVITSIGFRILFVSNRRR